MREQDGIALETDYDDYVNQQSVFIGETLEHELNRSRPTNSEAVFSEISQQV